MSITRVVETNLLLFLDATAFLLATVDLGISNTVALMEQDDSSTHLVCLLERLIWVEW